jgi:hypothetical protein
MKAYHSDGNVGVAGLEQPYIRRVQTPGRVAVNRRQGSISKLRRCPESLASFFAVQYPSAADAINDAYGLVDTVQINGFPVCIIAKVSVTSTGTY